MGNQSISFQQIQKKMVNFLKTKAEYDACLKDNQKVVIDFTASWCPPCKMIGPVFEGMSQEADNAGWTFVKVDVDENAETSEFVGISCMPTFQFYIGGEKKA